MRKMMAALGALALALGVSTVSVEPSKGIGFSAAHAQAKKAKRPAAKKAAPKKKSGYQRRCKKGERWNATATLTAGACEKIAKSKPKARPKAKKKA